MAVRMAQEGCVVCVITYTLYPDALIGELSLEHVNVPFLAHDYMNWYFMSALCIQQSCLHKLGLHARICMQTKWCGRFQEH